MLLPAVVLTIIFRYVPIAGLSIAFMDYQPVFGFFDQRWIGWDNFEYVFNLPGFFNVLWNTLFIAVMKIIGNLIVPVVFALLLNEVRNRLFKQSVQTMLYLPHFLSWVALAGVLIDILSPSSGIINNTLAALGIKPIFFLGNPETFPYTLVITDVWKEFGWGTIIYLAAITTIDPTQYEAAIIDGAGRWKQTLHVTLPALAPVILLLMVLGIGNVLQAGFDQVYNLYSPQVYSTGDIIDTLVYRIGIVDVQFGPATAVGFFKSAVSFVLIVIGYKLANKWAGYKVF
ncbi:MAG: ABC transporter permease subunit [Paenibacillus macerans]|uniref:ABC transporter permease subunit n=1 Tax=Paenibacillus macerans TaxID=44252 RepID=A0A090ZEB0_PAEMA|nr:ABC transporter permease subunit [Paenibacillus macerans]KFN08555.1 binding--dependent transport system inner membrane component family protein [Paenibacillus macerans]MBS5911447.1 sugar ABC transporter permease [Paenibacillus macerans]MCY7559152.1 ABC transporter permease subunit [Paenibacillus macerans]MDU7474956.1 ABC transporter permease subunit [Paenibacillus macerans]MEC0149316.1 ABC transporter permease subunit [Paenibacillus macerans]